MTDKQPKALRLADHLEDQGYYLDYDAAAELRRLHEVNSQLAQVLRNINDAACYASEEDVHSQPEVLLHIGTIARSAIAKATGEQQ
jgi:hypothetical protein